MKKIHSFSNIESLENQNPSFSTPRIHESNFFELVSVIEQKTSYRPGCHLIVQRIVCSITLTSSKKNSIHEF